MTIFRRFPCEGWCGRDVLIPSALAHQIICPNGDVRTGYHILCADCLEWFKKVIEAAHQAINHNYWG